MFSLLSRLSFLFFVFLYAMVNGATASGKAWFDESPYFPEIGRAAIFQRSLDLQNPLVVLAVAMEPGFEDLPTLTYLRLGRGARVISLYVTSGEGTPSDLSGEPPFRVAATRKEEAYRTLSHIGGETHFLNLPDLGFVSTREDLARMWIPDSLRASLLDILHSYRPDAILFSRDYRADTGETIRQSFIQEILLNAVRATDQWQVQQILVDRGVADQPVRSRPDSLHPIWKKSYRQIASEAAEYYKSLHIQRSYRLKGQNGTYSSVYSRSQKTPLSLAGGFSLHTARLQWLSRRIARLTKAVNAGGGVNTLPSLSTAIDSVEWLLGEKSKQLENSDRRVLLTWKNRLESLRCALLSVDVEFTVSESLLTQYQLFYFNVKKFTAKVTGGNTSIVFPGVRTAKWIVNEQFNLELPLDLGKDYRVLTPRDFENNTPGAVYGIDKAFVRTPFTFVIVHRDSLRERSFQYRRDIPLRGGPRFSSEILTPVVYVVPDELLAYRFQNISRDGVFGEAFVEDSIAVSDKRQFGLGKKDSWVQDTLRLRWSKSIKPGDHILDLKISDIAVGHFVARNFEVKSDTSLRVGLFTGLRGTPVQDALRRLQVSHGELGDTSSGIGGLSSLNSIIIDRDAFSIIRELPEGFSKLASWVQSGGHLIVFPQYFSDVQDWTGQGEVGFQLWPGIPPNVELTVDTSHTFFSVPNEIRRFEWEGWIFSRAWGAITAARPEEWEFPVRSPTSNLPLMATKAYGDGRITYVALDFHSQLLNLHPGVYRLLANLLSYRYIEKKE